MLRWGPISELVTVMALPLLGQPRPFGAVHFSAMAQRAGSSPLIGTSASRVRLRHEIGRMATTTFTVLVKEESGSGKELVAREIHEQSSRSKGPFVAVNCAALVETLLEAELFGIEDRTATGVRGRPGKFELADGGTLLLDEVADLSLPAQAKLLRAIQEMAVERVGGHVTRALDTRLVVATNKYLRDLVASERFRADLYYRLSGLEIRVPPLRERRSDILLLADHFVQRHPVAREIHLSEAAVDALMTYDWPGNVRELQRVIERAMTLSPTGRIAPEDLPPRVTGEYAERLLPSLVRDDTMRARGSRYARLVLDRCDNNKRKACLVLGISDHTLQAYLRYPRPTPSRQPRKRREPSESGSE